MSNQTIPDPGRFRRQEEPDDARSGGSRALSALLLLVLVVGIPALLWLLAGTDPFPTELPDQGDAHRPAHLHHAAQRAALRGLARLGLLRGLRRGRGGGGPSRRARPTGATRWPAAEAGPGTGGGTAARRGDVGSGRVRGGTRALRCGGGSRERRTAVRPALLPTPSRLRPSDGPRTRSRRRSTSSGTRSTRSRRPRTATTTTSGTSPSGCSVTAGATGRSTS